MHRLAPACPSPPVEHYENFPVASWLCPARLRPAITALYWFARTADDIADEGNAPASVRLDDLTRFRSDLQAITRALPHSGQWPQVFDPLARAMEHFALPAALLEQLLDAFEQDVRFTASGQRYQTDAELLDYCAHSANPVGRLLLHLYGVTNAHALLLSDDICTALQLINFWQDLSLDLRRGRFYLPQQDCARFGVTQADLLACRQTPAAANLIAACVASARIRMQQGAALVHQIPGRAGWELRLVVQGGLRILDKIEALRFATLTTRPTLKGWDLPVMLWRALWM